MLKHSIDQLSASLKYDFINTKLLYQALTHKSFGRSNYERLEFVGDSILDYVIASNLYANYSTYSEGELSQIRAALVNQDTLAAIAEEINLGNYLLMGDGEEKSCGRSRPSILADSLEAIFAAISFDSCLANAEKVILSLYRSRLANLDGIIKKDSKSLLQEYLQARRLPVPNYIVREVTGPDHDSIFNVECAIPDLNIKMSAKGKSKKEASQSVAQMVLTFIQTHKDSR